jgi:hypothetical protein
MKDVKGYENFYQVSEEGYVFSKRYQKKLKTFTTKAGYDYVDLYDGETKQRFAVHRLVASHFINEPENDLDVNHKDKNRQNNHVSNLEWLTRRENILHSQGHKGRKVARLDKKTLEILETYTNMGEAVLQGFNKVEIIHCCKGRTNSHYGFKWKYLD